MQALRMSVRLREAGQDLIDDARVSANVSNVLLGVGIVGIATGGILWLTAPDATPRERSALQVVPITTSTDVSLVVRGAF